MARQNEYDRNFPGREEPSNTTHPQVTDPTKVKMPLGAEMDAEGVIHIGADGVNAG
jgi:hypothetical protein